MNLRKHIVIGAAAAALLAGSALPVSAATITTFSILGGGLALSAPATAALPNVAPGTPVVSGSLGTTSVSDSRGLAVGWIVSAASTAFTGPGSSSSTAVLYTGGVATTTGFITVASGLPTPLTTTAAPVMTGVGAVGVNTASWNADLAVTMPASSLAGDYTGTVTTSIL